MAVSHSYNIIELVQKNDGSGIVCCVKFEIVSTDDVTTTSVSYKSKCELADPAPGEEIPYLSLDMPTVLGWVQTHAKLPAVATMEANNAERINSIDNPPTPATKVDPLPWQY